MNTSKQWPTKWAGKSWKTLVGGKSVLLTEAELKAFYEAIPLGKDAMIAALGVPGLQSRKADRALSLLKAEKLIWFNPETRLWEVSE